MKHTSHIFLFILCLAASISHAQLPSYLPTNGLVAWYPFNGNANDESGNGNNGVVNGALLTSDRFESTNKAYYFDGLTSSIVIPHSSDFNFELNNSYSISFWLKPEILSANQAQIVAMKQEGVGYTQDGWNSFIEPNYKMNFFVQNGSNPYSGCNRGSVTTSIFQHVAQVFRPDSVIVFINGVWAGAEPSNGATVGNNSNSLFFGLPWWGLIYSNSRGYNGILDDVAIYNRALTQTEVAAIYTSTPTNTGGGTTSTNTAPPGIPYQAEVRNESGEVLANTNVNVRFTLHELSANGAVSYQETHALTSNELGLFAATIGAGTATQGTFAGINWSQTTKFLQVEVDTGNGYITMGNQQLMSVPYALYAANGPQGPVGPQGPAGADGSQGSTGATGLGITATQIANDSLIVTYSNSQTQNAGKVKTSYIAGNGISINNDTISATNSNSIANAPNLTDRTNIGFASSGIWTCPAGVTQIMVQLWGGGGGGGSGFAGNFTVGCASNCVFKTGRNGGNGGNGGYNRQLVAVVPGMVYDITVGSGGIGGNTLCGSGSSNSGSAGGISIFNNQLSAGGGGGGTGGSGCSDGDNGISAAVVNYNANNITMAIQSVSSPIGYIPNGYITTIILPASQAGGGAGGAGGSQPSCGPCPTGGGNGQNGFCVISY